MPSSTSLPLKEVETDVLFSWTENSDLDYSVQYTEDNFYGNSGSIPVNMAFNTPIELSEAMMRRQ